MAKKFNIIDEAGKVISDEQGPFVSKKFYEQHFQKILIVIILLISYIQLRYEYEDHIIKIARLKNERNDVRYTSIEKWGDLTTRNRPEVIKNRVAESDVNLIESDEPAVIIKK
ncbi:MAG: hypothetical protein J5543_06070 [Bacteroidales bacterium]|nr:hypothetical protein [Bacteroidales bacterium]